jgi:Fe-S-cluster containining protein
MANEEESKKPAEDDSGEKKSKFVFKCTRCGDCCIRGDIPLTFWDLELWAKNKVVANMFPHLAVVPHQGGMIDLVIKAIPMDEKSETEKKETSESPEASHEEDEADKKKGIRCPLYRISDKTCLIYENRPIYCREFPLEYDGKAFALAEEPDCPGVGEGPMSKEELQQIREDARICHGELRRMRISLPILHQIISQNTIQAFLQQIARDSEERMKNLSEEDRRKMDEISRKMGGPGEQDAD